MHPQIGELNASEGWPRPQSELSGRPGILHLEWTIYCLRGLGEKSTFDEHGSCLLLFGPVCPLILICSLQLRLWQFLGREFPPGEAHGSSFFSDFYQYYILFNFIWMHIVYPLLVLWLVTATWL